MPPARIGRAARTTRPARRPRGRPCCQTLKGFGASSPGSDREVLPWVTGKNPIYPERVAAIFAIDPNGLHDKFHCHTSASTPSEWNIFPTLTQGGSCLATLRSMLKPRWGFQFARRWRDTYRPGATDSREHKICRSSGAGIFFLVCDLQICSPLRGLKEPRDPHTQTSRGVF